MEDSDFEVPDAFRKSSSGISEKGYLWLATLCSNGFGGILADDMGLDITPYKHIFKKIVELQPEASIETIWNIYTTIAAVSDEDKHTSSSLPNVSNIDSALDDSEPSMSDKSDPSVPTSDSSVSHEK